MLYYENHEEKMILFTGCSYRSILYFCTIIVHQYDLLIMLIFVDKAYEVSNYNRFCCNSNDYFSTLLSSNTCYTLCFKLIGLRTKKYVFIYIRSLLENCFLLRMQLIVSTKWWLHSAELMYQCRKRTACAWIHQCVVRHFTLWRFFFFIYYICFDQISLWYA